MLTTISILLNLFLVTNEQIIDNGHCDIESERCIGSENIIEQKYIFYDVNQPEGFNLRRDVYMRFTIMLTEARKSGKRSNWSLVLPPWDKLYHWKSHHSRTEPAPWSAFFDIVSLKSYAPVVELHEVFSKTSKLLQIDTLYVLQNYEDAFEGGTFVEKWEESGDDCYYDGQYWGYTNVTAKEIICVKFQGKISKLWELIMLHPKDKTIMFAHGEIPLHDSYGTKSYWECRKSMKFNVELVEIAKNYIKTYLNCVSEKCDSYLSIHWRRQDFSRSRQNDVPSMQGTVKQIQKFIKKNCPQINNIFIASDASKPELNNLVNELKKLNLNVFIYEPTISHLEKYKDGGVAIIDQIICSHAAFFIGTHESTFSFRIQEEREILGFNSHTTFNRLCPDKGPCERPSKWTIVH